MVIVVFQLGYPALRRNAGVGVPERGSSMPSGGAEATSVDLSVMPLEEQALTLFDRVMRSASVGDTADVSFFLPKALVVHEQLAPEDADGIFHFTLLHLAGNDHRGALEKAREGLERVPEHLLLLAAAGEAAAALGDTAAATEYYGRYVESYETEMGRVRSGYEHHQPLFPIYLQEARAFLGQG
jgi:hypothetical protein